MEKVDITIIGAGVVGLAIASTISELKENIIVIEKHLSFGQETSSRNSEVIHASIYYPQNSLKGKLCLEGNEILYDLCERNRIPFRNTGKLIVATNKNEEEALPGLLNSAINNGAKGVRLVSKKEVQKIEPKVFATSAIWCPTSGVVDSHSLMQYFESNAISKGVTFLYSSEVIAIEKLGSGYEVEIKNRDSSITKFKTEILINSAGLNSGNIAELVGLDIDILGYRISYHKGVYYRAIRKLEQYPEKLIYPVPPYPGSVGIHTCPDLHGGMRLGPHFFWVDSVDYSVNDSFRLLFYESAKSYLPFLEIDDIQPDMSGIMSSVQKHGENMKDFIIKNEAERGFPNFINLIGIESPGLTASPAIAKMIKKMIE